MDGEFRDEVDGLLSAFRAGSRVAGYWLEEQIGAGGMAVVFRARDERLDRWVALKILDPVLAADEVFRRRFIREARAAAAVDDPHIIPVFETGEAAGALFIAMRYVPGGDARSLVRRVGPLPAGRAAAIVCSVAAALDAAHAAGLVHRDVKPANILMNVRPGRPDHAYLSDFGISKGARSSTGPIGPGQFLGTVGYAAPEQIGGTLVDGQADQYSLACAAFERLSGMPPFARGNAGAVIWGHVSEPPPLLTSRRPELPAMVDNAVAKALAKAPEDRYASCGDFAHALCSALDLASKDSEATASLRPDHRRARIVRPAPAGSGWTEGIPVAASSAKVSRARRTLKASPAPGGQETMPSCPPVPSPRARRARARLPHQDGSRLVTAAAVFIATVSVALVVSHLGALAMARHAPAPPYRTPVHFSYMGIDVASRPGYRAVADFAKAAGQPSDPAGHVTNWGTPFAASYASMIQTHKAIPLDQIDPAGLFLAEIAAGEEDAYLRVYATSVRNFGKPVVMSFGQDMNTGQPWVHGSQAPPSSRPGGTS